MSSFRKIWHSKSFSVTNFRSRLKYSYFRLQSFGQTIERKFVAPKLFVINVDQKQIINDLFEFEILVTQLLYQNPFAGSGLRPPQLCKSEGKTKIDAWPSPKSVLRPRTPSLCHWVFSDFSARLPCQGQSA